MPLNLPTFYKRTGTAIVFAAVMLVGLLWNDWALLALICLINTLCLYEYCKLMQLINKDAYWPKWLPYLLQIVTTVPLVFYGLIRIPENQAPFEVLNAAYNAIVIGLLLLLFPIAILLAGALSKQTYLFPAIQGIAGALYITLPLTLLFVLRNEDFIFPIAIILMIWTNDTMAYLVGSFIGKTPFSSISPKKTWEGTIGGGVLTVIGAGIYGHFSHKYRVIDWVMLGAIVAIFGTLGDLFESKLKRMADVKDSGSFMPGHGGALDRFDSLLVAAPFVFVYVVVFMR